MADDFSRFASEVHNHLFIDIHYTQLFKVAMLTSVTVSFEGDVPVVTYRALLHHSHYMCRILCFVIQQNMPNFFMFANKNITQFSYILLYEIYHLRDTYI